MTGVLHILEAWALPVGLVLLVVVIHLAREWRWRRKDEA